MFPCLYRLLLPLLLLLATGAQARQIEDAFGRWQTVPDQPKRVITLSEIDLDIALALGAQPIGSVNGRGQSHPPRYLADALQTPITVVGDLDSPNLEQILELEPDLILTGQTRPELLALLQEIAPTLVTARWGTPWQDTLARTARVLNREPQARAFMQRYQRRLVQARERLAAHQGQSFSVVRWNPKGPAYMFRDAFASQVVQELGLVRPDYQQDPGHTHSLSLSLESLQLLDADWLVIGTLSTSGEAVEALAQAEQNPAFRQLGAIRRGHYGAVDGSLWTSVGGPLAALKVIDDVEQLLTGTGR